MEKVSGEVVFDEDIVADIGGFTEFWMDVCIQRMITKIDYSSSIQTI